jgi:Recombinase zinc beta ribbon domain
VLIPNAHEGYVSWEEFERIQRTISANARGSGQVGAAREGRAILGGLLRCRRCASKLTLHYTGGQHDAPRYTCHRAWLDKGQARCISFGGTRVDAAVTQEVLRAVQPAAIEASIMAHEEEAKKRDEVLAALQRDLQAARYAAQRAQRQFDAADPENRLVADELERRWNQALQRVREVEGRIEQHSLSVGRVPSAGVEEFADLAAQLEAIWHQPDADVRLKKRITRSLIHEVVVDMDTTSSEIVLVIHWKGGVHTEVRVPRRRRGQNMTHTSKETIDAVRMLARIC